MCRYILATPSNEADASHNVRVIFGNGLRPQIWPQFINRFKIPHVSEFYGATEGNANIGKLRILSSIRLDCNQNNNFYCSFVLPISEYKQCCWCNWFCIENHSIGVSNFNYKS